MDIRHQIAELSRIQRNLFTPGVIKSVADQRVTVTLTINETEIDTDKLIVIGGGSANAGDPVIAILPTANPGMGYIMPIVSALALMNELEQRINQLEQRVSQLEAA